MFIAPYLLLLAVVGIYPIGYAVHLAFTSLADHYSGTRNFVKSFQDPEFLPAFAHIGVFILIWLTALVVLVVGLSLILHSLIDGSAPLSGSCSTCRRRLRVPRA